MANLSGKVNYVLLCTIFDHTVLALHFVLVIDIYFENNRLYDRDISMMGEMNSLIENIHCRNIPILCLSQDLFLTVLCVLSFDIEYFSSSFYF